LQSFAGFQLIKLHPDRTEQETFKVPRVFFSTPRTSLDRDRKFHYDLVHNHVAGTLALCEIDYGFCLGLNQKIINSDKSLWRFQSDDSGFAENALPLSFIVYAYGVGRRLSSSSGNDDNQDDPAVTLFNDHAQLRNAEEWLLLLDYTASKESDVRAQQITRREQIKELLISILEGVEDIRFDAGSGAYPRPKVEFKTFSG
jgi:hypothetical protein